MAYIILFLSALLSLIFLYLIFRSTRKVRELSNRYLLPIKIKSTHLPNAYQAIVEYDTDSFDNISGLFTTLTIHREFDPFSIFEVQRPENIVINIIFTKPMQSFYVYKKGLLKHLGIQFSSKYLLNKTSYLMHGSISEKLYKFSEKYNFSYFYSSYIPENSDIKSDTKCSFAEVRIDLKECSDSLFSDLIEILKDSTEESPKKHERISREFKVLHSKLENTKKMGFFDKLNNSAKLKGL